MCKFARIGVVVLLTSIAQAQGTPPSLRRQAGEHSPALHLLEMRDHVDDSAAAKPDRQVVRLARISALVDRTKRTGRPLFGVHCMCGRGSRRSPASLTPLQAASFKLPPIGGPNSGEVVRMRLFPNDSQYTALMLSLDREQARELRDDSRELRNRSAELVAAARRLRARSA